MHGKGAPRRHNRLYKLHPVVVLDPDAILSEEEGANRGSELVQDARGSGDDVDTVGDRDDERNESSRIGHGEKRDGQSEELVVQIVNVTSRKHAAIDERNYLPIVRADTEEYAGPHVKLKPSPQTSPVPSPSTDSEEAISPTWSESPEPMASASSNTTVDPYENDYAEPKPAEKPPEDLCNSSSDNLPIDPESLQLPKLDSFIRVDSRTTIPLRSLEPFKSKAGTQYQIDLASHPTIWERVLASERGWTSEEEHVLNEVLRNLEIVVHRKADAEVFESYKRLWLRTQGSFNEKILLRSEPEPSFPVAEKFSERLVKETNRLLEMECQLFEESARRLGIERWLESMPDPEKARPVEDIIFHDHDMLPEQEQEREIFFDTAESEVRHKICEAYLPHFVDEWYCSQGLLKDRREANPLVTNEEVADELAERQREITQDLRANKGRISLRIADEFHFRVRRKFPPPEKRCWELEKALEEARLNRKSGQRGGQHSLLAPIVPSQDLHATAASKEARDDLLVGVVQRKRACSPCSPRIKWLSQPPQEKSGNGAVTAHSYDELCDGYAGVSDDDKENPSKRRMERPCIQRERSSTDLSNRSFSPTFQRSLPSLPPSPVR